MTHRWRLRNKRRLGPLLLVFVIVVTFVYSTYKIRRLLGHLESDAQDGESDDEDTEHFHQHAESENKEMELLASAESLINNLPPPEFLLNPPKGKSTCGTFPDLYDIEFSNIHWQVQQIKNVTFYLYSAYYDQRTKDAPVIRILAMVNEPETVHLSVSATCQLWYAYQHIPIFSPATSEAIWFHRWSLQGRYTAYMLTCPVALPENNVPLVSVSVVGSNCDKATNNLKITIYETSSLKKIENAEDFNRQRRFGVCVKGLDFLHEDNSLRLVEWIELLLILGVDKIFFYEFTLHPNVKKVLNYYEKLGKIDVKSWTLPGTFPNEPNLRHLFLSNRRHSPNKRKNEVLPYNDCLYRNLNDFDYLAILDTDEIILPKNGKTWNHLIAEIDARNADESAEIGTYCFRNVYFFDAIPEEEMPLLEKIPSHMHMLQHVYRSANYTPPTKFIKCIHSTTKTKFVHNHFPLGCVDGPCRILQTNVNIAHLQHYRSTCVRDLKDCKEYEKSSVRDLSIWKYKEQLLENANKALSILQLNGTFRLFVT